MAIDWAKVIAFVLRLIDTNEAISKASSKFGVSISAIKQRM